MTLVAKLFLSHRCLLTVSTPASPLGGGRVLDLQKVIGPLDPISTMSVWLHCFLLSKICSPRLVTQLFSLSRDCSSYMRRVNGVKFADDLLAVVLTAFAPAICEDFAKPLENRVYGHVTCLPLY